MNASGLAVPPLLQRHRLGLEDLIVIHDDLDLPLGKIRIRQGSSAGGHNGIKSIIAALGTQDFIRIRVGIGRPQSPDENRDQDVVDYVLGEFSREDKPLLDQTILRVGEAVVSLLTEGIDTAMNKFN